MITAGIYYIKCLVTNKYYIGSSKNITKRFNAHKRKLMTQKHANKILQNQWDKYGEESFEFEIIEEVDGDGDIGEAIKLLEQQYFEDDNYNIELNCVKKVIVTKGDFDQYRQSCRIYRISEETKQKIARTLKEKGISPEQLQYMKKRNDEDRLQHPEKYIISDIQRKSIAERSQRVYKFIHEGEVINILNLSQFCREKQLHYKTMHKVASGIRKQYKGYTKFDL